MLLIAIIILLLIAVCCISILLTYRMDSKNKRYFLFSFVITMVGTFSGVLAAVALSDFHNDMKEKKELKAIMKQAYVEVNTVSYKISDSMGNISSLLGESRFPSNKSEMRIYKQKLKAGKAYKAISTIRYVSNSELVDKLMYCELLYNNPLSSKHIFPSCRTLMYLLSMQERTRQIIRKQNTTIEDRFEAIIDYWKITNDISQLISLSEKALNGKITNEEESEIQKLAGFSQVITGKDGKEYHISPFPD